MNIEEIKKKIQIILELPQLKPFGGIYMNPVLEQAKVAQIEKENRITFPTDYRTFITQIANGCVGPDYGLRSLKEATEDLMWKDRTIDLSTPFPYTEPWNEEEWLNSIIGTVVNALHKSSSKPIWIQSASAVVCKYAI